MKLTRSLSSQRSSRIRRFTASTSAVAIMATLTGGAVSDAASTHATSSLVMSALKTTTYGTILQSTRTVYTLTPSKVACTAKCLTYWPEVLLPKGTTRATAGHGVNGAKLGTIKRADGRLQVTYAGKALYWFVNDKAPGQVKGNVSDTWGKWSVAVLIKPTGGGNPTTTTTTGGGGGGIGF
jgi:predicted lipoprotein with Yx(FWY)xxD motif